MLKNECTRNCWLAAALAGLLVWLFNIFAGLFFGGLLLGLITFYLLGHMLVWAVCSGRGGVVESAAVLGATGVAQSRPDADGGILDRAETAVVNASAALAENTVTAVEKGREAIREKREARDRAWQEADQASPAADAAPAASAQDMAGKTASPAPAVASAVAETGRAGQAQAETSPANSANEADANPVKAAAVDGSPDNLKEIKGVGPQLEKLLHENGITSFAQIAGWTDADIDHFAELIGRMGGRIRSDEWVAQAQVLAAGGDTEFSARVDRGELY